MTDKTHAARRPLAAGRATAMIGRYRWVICALLFFATTINYMDRQILSLVKENLDREIGWSNAQFGWVNGAFQLAYGIGLLGFGRFIDRFGTKLGYAVSIAAWSMAALGHGLVGSLRGFITARVCLGLGEGGNFPSAIKAVALWFPKQERALATSIFNSGTNVGAIIAPAIVPWVAFAWGWRTAFVLAGVAGFLWLFLWLPFYNVPEKIRRLTPGEAAYIHSDIEEEGGGRNLSWLDLLAHRQAWSFIVAKFLTDPVWWFLLIWLPDYFKQTRSLDIKKSWILIVTIYAIVTMLSIAGGWVTGYLAGRGWTITRARKTCMFVFALCALPMLFVTRVGDWTAVVLIGVAGAAHQAWSANLYTTVSDMFPKRTVASLVGLGGMAGALSGFMFPILTGMMLDHFEKHGRVTAGYGILFGVCACAYLLTFGLNHALAPRFEPIRFAGTRI